MPKLSSSAETVKTCEPTNHAVKVNYIYQSGQQMFVNISAVSSHTMYVSINAMNLISDWWTIVNNKWERWEQYKAVWISMQNPRVTSEWFSQLAREEASVSCLAECWWECVHCRMQWLKVNKWWYAVKSWTSQKKTRLKCKTFIFCHQQRHLLLVTPGSR